jgi:hypothetical protein
MPETERQSTRKPQFRTGDIVFADSSWFLVTNKSGQRCMGRLLGSKNLQEYPFTSRSVERVFREMGKSTKGSGHDDR